MVEYPNKIVELCNSTYQKIYGDYNAKSEKKIVVSHFGEFSQDLVNSLSNGVEETMFEAGDKKGTIKRMFSILVEGLQNVRIHGEKDEDSNQISFLIIAQDENEYLVTIANLVKNEVLDKIISRIDELNAMDEAEVKAYYMDTLTNGIMSQKGGAGLGFITMAMKSKNKLNYIPEQVSDELTCFSLEIKIARKK
jgi:hypothetical protein